MTTNSVLNRSRSPSLLLNPLYLSLTPSLSLVLSSFTHHPWQSDIFLPIANNTFYLQYLAARNIDIFSALQLPKLDKPRLIQIPSYLLPSVYSLNNITCHWEYVKHKLAVWKQVFLSRLRRPLLQQSDTVFTCILLSSGDPRALTSHALIGCSPI